MPTTEASRRAPRRDAAENRAALLAAAASVLAGSPDASLDAVAAAAGLSRRSVYGHFADRDDLVRALIGHGADRLNDVARASDDADPRVALALTGARLWEAVEHVRLLARLALTDAYVEAAARALGPLRARVLVIVERGTASGAIRNDLPASLVARLVEESAIAVLAEATTRSLDRAEGARVLMLAVLGAAGLSWREAGALLDTTPALRAELT